MEEDIIDLLESLVESRNTFLNRTINLIQHSQRTNVFSRFMANETMYLHITSSLLRVSNNNSAVVTFTIPSNFTEPVIVRPTQEEINTALETITSSNSNCAICQDLISFDGVKVRHCGHEFHRSCILSWFEINVRCPVCRQDIRDPITQTPSASIQTSSQSQGQ